LTRRALIVALLATALLAPACGNGNGGADAAAAAAPGAPTTSTSPTTTTAPPPPGGRRPTADEPLRVLMAGDSLMADISLAIASTLQDGGQAVARLVAAPSIPRDDTTRALWHQQLDQYDPEVIVIMIGVWEGMAEDALSTLPLGSPAWLRTYRHRNLDPYLDLLTSEGAEVVWVGMPPAQDPERQLEFSSLNRAVRQAAQASPDLIYIPGDTILANPDGSWADILPGPHGTPQRVRRIDTTHLCADGASRLARPVLNHLGRQWGIPLADDWPNRNWRWVFPAADCPPV
jgi:hypothetical protein